jgi:hypothetical protein
LEKIDLTSLNNRDFEDMKKKIGEKIYKVIMNKGIEEVGDRDLDSILGGLLMILPSMIMKFDL